MLSKAVPPLLVSGAQVFSSTQMCLEMWWQHARSTLKHKKMYFFGRAVVLQAKVKKRIKYFPPELHFGHKWSKERLVRKLISNNQHNRTVSVMLLDSGNTKILFL